MAAPAKEDDWLFGRQTKYCDWTVDYSNSTVPMDVGAQCTMTFLYVMAMIAVLLMPRRREGTELPVNHDPAATNLKVGLTSPPQARPTSPKGAPDS